MTEMMFHFQRSIPRNAIAQTTIANQSTFLPAGVQQAAQAEAKGGTIVRWEKEGANFEAVINKNGRQIGIEIDANGKVLSKHDEAKEHKEKGEKY
jgi:hypothetical protein